MIKFVPRKGQWDCWENNNKRRRTPTTQIGKSVLENTWNWATVTPSFLLPQQLCAWGRSKLLVKTEASIPNGPSEVLAVNSLLPFWELERPGHWPGGGSLCRQQSQGKSANAVAFSVLPRPAVPAPPGNLVELHTGGHIPGLWNQKLWVESSNLWTNKPAGWFGYILKFEGCHTKLIYARNYKLWHSSASTGFALYPHY